jgi:transposase
VSARACARHANGVGLALDQAQISYDRFHVIAMAKEAMDEVDARK